MRRCDLGRLGGLAILLVMASFAGRVEADEIRCRAHLESSTPAITALVPSVGYTRACDLLRKAQRSNRPIRDLVGNGHESAERFEELALGSGRH